MSKVRASGAAGRFGASRCFVGRECVPTLCRFWLGKGGGAIVGGAMSAPEPVQSDKPSDDPAICSETHRIRAFPRGKARSSGAICHFEQVRGRGEAEIIRLAQLQHGHVHRFQLLRGWYRSWRDRSSTRYGLAPARRSRASIASPPQARPSGPRHGGSTLLSRQRSRTRGGCCSPVAATRYDAAAHGRRARPASPRRPKLQAPGRYEGSRE